MLEWIKDLIIHFLEQVQPWIVIRAYDRGLRLRFGLNKGILQPGLRWKIPFVDEVLIQQVTMTTMVLPEQTITTKDNQSIVVKSVIKYEVDNIEKLLLDVSDARDAMADMTQGIIRNILITKDWHECNTTEIPKAITEKARSEADKWGLKIKTVTLTDLGLMRSIRLIGNLTGNNNDQIFTLKQ